jgi:D-alanyl-lipoteichoic acid acyltransferase DltB (MBOAT superfamily)
MESASFEFLLFGLAVAICSNFSQSQRWRSGVLLLASVVFCALQTRNLLLFLPLLGFLALGYLVLLLLERGWSRIWVPSIFAIVLAFVWLKKYTFLPHDTFLRFPYVTLGLSYIFFRVLHLVIESKERAGEPGIGLFGYLCYTLNFTTLVSGPIQRYDEFARDQFAQKPTTLGARVAGLQIERIIRGYFKVNVLALLFDMVHADALLELAQPAPASVKIFAAARLAVSYPLFLYANFSGYIDIVIALARLMRLRLPENFDRPFCAASFLDFWNRWHITLSTWLKTYVYNALLLSLMRRTSSPKVQQYLGILCFFVTFFLIGIWHGRTSEFVIFGVLQGGGVAVNKLWQVSLSERLGRRPYKNLAANPLYTAFARGLTFSWFAFTLFWFWAGWAQLDSVFLALSPGQWILVWLFVWSSATAVLAAWEAIRASLLSIQVRGTTLFTSSYARVICATTLALVSFEMMALLDQPAPDIVYKAF